MVKLIKPLLIILLIFQIATVDYLKDDFIETLDLDLTKKEDVQKLAERLKEKGKVPPKKEPLPNTDECLASDEELAKMGIKEADENQRFILGKCYPIIFSNGVYAARISAEFNCKGLAANRKKMQEIRVFCGDAFCEDETVDHEEHVLFPAILGSAFNLVEVNKTKYSACLGYVMTHYNSKEDCAEIDGEGVCRYDDNIRIKYYGGTRDTKDEARCGLKALDGVASTSIEWIDEIINLISPLNVYKKFIEEFDSMGYREGFSMAGLPQDYRRFTSLNKFNIKAFTYQVNRLYEQTGKPVILVGHSYGCNAIYAFLSQASPDVLKKVKTFLAMAPPFAGSTKLLSVFLDGSNDFNKEFVIDETLVLKTDFSKFAQHIIYGVAPVLAELPPLPVMHEWLTNTETKAFAAAIQERMELTKKCFYENCEPEYVKQHSELWESIYGKDFPSFNDEECKVEGFKNPKKILRYLQQGKSKTKSNEGESFFDDYNCRVRLYKEGICPTLMVKNEGFNPEPADFENLCGVYNSSIYYAETCGKYKGHTCVDEIYSTPPYPYKDYEKMDWLLNRYNTEWADKFDGEKLDRSFFEQYEPFKKKCEANAKLRREQFDYLRELKVPPVDTIIMYGGTKKTKTGLIYDPTKEEDPSEDREYYKGGDETVPNWSSYLVGLKWLYDVRKNNLTQKITLAEYCSKLSQPGSKYAFDKKKKQTYYALDCDCLSYDYEYETDKCTHSGMLDDDYLVEYTADISIDEDMVVTEEMQKAYDNYQAKDFIAECNNGLYEFANM